MSAETDRLNTALAGRYTIERELGAGGMATVYLAHDLKHDRDVAIKVLHEDLGATLGPERFLAEIKTTAKLQHPHILPLLDSGAGAGLLYYVMPYVAGETLRDRLTRETQLPIEDAVRIAREVADALSHAHGHGIIHRDIKPENILLQGGHAVVADFGIALAVQHAGGARLTQSGLSLGTPQYMAPEQAMGDRTVDHHADIYALGAVAYEMLTGEPPFTGATAQAIVAKVLNSEPALPTLTRKTIPAHVEAAVLKAIAKLPADRWATAGEFAAALAAAPSPGGLRDLRAIPASTSRWKYATVGLALALATALVIMLLRTSVPGRTTRVEVDAGAAYFGTVTSPVVIGAPDGSSFVYCTSEGSIWIRRWDSLAPTRVPGAKTGCISAAFSPDGRLFAVIGQPTSLRIVSLAGDLAPRVLVVNGLDDIASYGGGVDWASDGNLYVASRQGLTRVSPTDGHAELIARTNASIARFSGVDVLPNAQAALVVASIRSPAGAPEERVGVVDFRTGKTELVLQGNAVRYVKPGYLVVAHSDGALMAVPFDLASLRPSGPAVPLADSIPVLSRALEGLIDVTDDGTLLYWRSVGSDVTHPVFVDRRGEVQEIRPLWTGLLTTPRLSNDDALLAMEVRGGGISKAWVRDLRSGQNTLVATGGLVNGRLTWKPDGSAITFVSDSSGSAALYEWPRNGGRVRAMPRYDPRPVFGAAWSRDGRWLFLRTDDQAKGNGDILAVRPAIDSLAVPVVADSSFFEYGPELSPDGRWLAYVTNATGTYEVRVTPFPDGRGQWQISTNGGSQPRWSHSGRELFFLSDDGYMMAADIAAGPGFRVAGLRRLFATSTFGVENLNFVNRNYDITADDRRFLMLRHNDALMTSRIVAVFNWAAELKSRVKR